MEGLGWAEGGLEGGGVVGGTVESWEGGDEGHDGLFLGGGVEGGRRRGGCRWVGWMSKRRGWGSWQLWAVGLLGVV